MEYTIYAYIQVIYTHTYMHSYTDMYMCTRAHMEYFIKYIQFVCLQKYANTYVFINLHRYMSHVCRGIYRYMESIMKYITVRYPELKFSFQ